MGERIDIGIVLMPGIPLDCNVICKMFLTQIPLKKLQQKVSDKRTLLKTKDRLLFDKTMAALNLKNKEEANKYSARIAELRVRERLLGEVILSIERLCLRIENFRVFLHVADFQHDYAHGSELRGQAISKFEFSVNLLKEQSRNMAFFLPDISKQIINETEKLEQLLSDSNLKQAQMHEGS